MAIHFAVCTPGLEPFVTQELTDLGISTGPSSRPGEDLLPSDDSSGDFGGVEFQGSLTDLYRANLHLRTASRVLLRLGKFYASTFSDLKRRVKRLSWEEYLPPGGGMALRVTCHKSRLYHSGAVAERVREGIGERLGTLPPVRGFQDDASAGLPPLILIRLVEDHCAVLLDSSGAHLHRRGYRLATAKAPLRETLAAGMILASGWDGRSPLLDPFCGAGTIAIEAALLASKIPPGLRRPFAFMDWPNFDAPLWEKVLGGAGATRKSRRPRIIASDRDAGAIEAAQANAKRAGVAEAIEFACRAISAIDPPRGAGWVITNPPHGVRLATKKDLRSLYIRLGKVLQTRCRDWQVAMLCGSSDLAHSTGINFQEEIPLRSGGLDVSLWKGRID